MELDLEIAPLVIDSGGDSNYIGQMLQRAREIIETSSLFSIHTFILHRQCYLKFSSCTGLVLLEEWAIKIVSRESSDKEKNAMRSYLHFSQLNSGVTCIREQLSNDAVCKYRIFVNGVYSDIQLRYFESHEFSLGRLNLSPGVYITVKWRKYGAFPLPHLSYFESHGLFFGDWLFSPMLFEGQFTSSSPRIPLFYVPFEYQQNSEKERIESEDIHTCKSPHLYFDPHFRFCQIIHDLFPVADEMLLENEQTVKLLVVQSLLSRSERSTETEFTMQAVPPSPSSRRETLPRRSLIASAFRFMSTASKAFSKTTGLPLHSSPAPFNRSATKFVENQSVKSTRNRIGKTAEEQTRAHILQNMSMDNNDNNLNCYGTGCTRRNTSSSSGLLCNFEESALNGRLEPIISLDGFHLQIAASDETCSPHLTLPVTTFFFNMSEDEAPLPYMGFCSLENMRKGYRIPKKGILQAVLFNPQGTVVQMFVVKFDVSDMPPSSQTFLRQRTFFMPVGCTYDCVLRSWLKYLIHLSLATDRRGRLYVHTDIKMLFSQKNELETLNFELGKDMVKYQLQSFTEMPRNPKYSPRK
ncbi:unnamed protein product [Wuchereria bancrofti]|uniref:Atos-like conserved domain-containing protein n=1 Tax=Wuchereria bancrofti TaxID=6293 RepID=A0A3P7DP14_WUCBA|nr:unnamed protein product [Wuchereria bancrofti]